MLILVGQILKDFISIVLLNTLDNLNGFIILKVRLIVA